MANRNEILAAVDKHVNPDRFREQHWSGNFHDYLDMVIKNPSILKIFFAKRRIGANKKCIHFVCTEENILSLKKGLLQIILRRDLKRSRFHLTLIKNEIIFPNVKCVIAGHTHTTVEQERDGMHQFTTPSTFAQTTHAQLGESVDHEDFWASHKLDGSRHGYRVLDLLPDGGVSTAVHWIYDD